MNLLEDENSTRGSRWMPLAGLCVSQLPTLGSCSGVYAFRDAETKEILYIGSTDCLRRRLLGNHLGGVGGATTKRVNGLLFDRGRVLRVEVRTFRSLKYSELEKQLKQAYALDHGGLPRWVRR